MVEPPDVAEPTSWEREDPVDEREGLSVTRRTGSAMMVCISKASCSLAMVDDEGDQGDVDGEHPMGNFDPALADTSTYSIISFMCL